MNSEVTEYSKEDVNILKTFKNQDDLCRLIFDENDKMHDDVRKKLLEISDSFIEFLGIEFFIHDIVLTGSLSNYKWSKYSDVDLHVMVDFEKSEYGVDMLKEFFTSKKSLWNEKHNITIKGFDVELYVQDINEEHTSGGIYSVLKNKWLIEPKKESYKIDKRKILSKSDDFIAQYELLKKKSNSEDVYNGADKLMQKLSKFRKSGLSKNGEHSYENLTFKLLRRNGFIKKLLDLKNKSLDKKLSLTQ